MQVTVLLKPEGVNFIGVDLSNSSLKTFKDDRGTNLLGSSAHSMTVLRPTRDDRIDDDWRLFAISSRACPKAGAKYLIAQGTLTILCGQEPKEILIKDVAVATNVKATIGNTELELGACYNRSPRADLSSKSSLALIKQVTLITADGEITASMYREYKLGDTKDKFCRAMGLPRPLEGKYDARITYWNDVKAIQVPFDWKIAIGGLASMQPSSSPAPAASTKPAAKDTGFRPLFVLTQSPAWTTFFPPDPVQTEFKELPWGAANQAAKTIPIIWKNGTHLAGIVTDKKRIFLRLDEAASSIESLAGDAGTDLLAGGACEGAGLLRCITLSDDRHQCMLGIDASSLPAAGTAEVFAKGTLTMICGINEKQTQIMPCQPDKLFKGNIGPTATEIGYYTNSGFDYLTLCSDKPLDPITGVCVTRFWRDAKVVNQKEVVNGHLDKTWDEVISGNRFYHARYIIMTRTPAIYEKVGLAFRYVEKTETVKLPLDAHFTLGN